MVRLSIILQIYQTQMNYLQIRAFLAILLLMLIIHPLCLAQSAKGDGIAPLRVSDSGHFLVREDGTPFFWLGDTAWALFSNLDREEVLKYLRDRKSKRFTVIQAHLLGWKIDFENAYGARPFINDDFREPNEAYWMHVDYIIETAESMGIYMAVLPAWSRSYIEMPSQPPDVTLLLQEDTVLAYNYGRFLGARYKDRKNLIWVLGGDVWGKRDGIYDNLARGLTETYALGDPDKILMTFHPQGGTHRPPATSTSEFYHNKEWLDFNMIQSGHRRGNRNYERIAQDYREQPVKPTLESEPCYEHHPIIHKFENGVFNAWDIRQRAYWSVFAGSLGFTYGGNGIWQMDKPGEIWKKETHHNFFWYDALNHEGASDMTHLIDLIESRSGADSERVPDQSLVVSDEGTTEDRIQCARANDYAYIMVYSTNGSAFTLDLSGVPAKKLKMWWYNPRDGKLYTGAYQATTKPFSVSRKRAGIMTFDPPGDIGDDNDWILVIDDAKPSLPAPGAK